jgi:hypothetical protein
MKERISHMGTDKTILRHVSYRPITVTFSNRSERGSISFKKGEIIWYTDGSYTNEGTGAGGVWTWVLLQPRAVHHTISGRSVCLKHVLMRIYTRATGKGISVLRSSP